jgi:hypothetical protein
VTYPLDLVATFRAAGLEVVDVRVPGRPGTFAPVGQIIHHTAGPRSGDAPSLTTCVRGKPGVPGGLCNALFARSGRIYVVTDGKANHAGAGSGLVLARTRGGLAPFGDAAAANLADTTTGNAYYYGWEIELDGIGEVLSLAALEAVLRANAAVATALGWTAARSILHSEWSRRKPDPRAPNIGRGAWWRDRISARLAAMVGTVVSAAPGRPDAVLAQPTQLPGERPMYAVRNAEGGEIRVAALAAGVGGGGLSWDGFLALEKAGVISPPPIPDANDNADGNRAGTRWANLPNDAFLALPRSAVV